MTTQRDTEINKTVAHYGSPHAVELSWRHTATDTSFNTKQRSSSVHAA